MYSFYLKIPMWPEKLLTNNSLLVEIDQFLKIIKLNNFLSAQSEENMPSRALISERNNNL